MFFLRFFNGFVNINFFEKSKGSRGDLGRTGANLGAQKGPKWSPKASQDGAKKEKKSEVKLREVSGRQKRVERSGREVVTSPLGE